MRNGVRLNKAKARDTVVKPSSGNVFADLAVPNSREALAKAELAHRICEAISQRRLTQAQAARLLGIDQPKVSALLRGKLDGFSTERLFRYLNALGQDVEIVIRPVRQGRKEAAIRVLTG